MKPKIGPKRDAYALLVIVINFFASMFVFSSGFLLTRNALNDANNKANSEFKKFDKAIILLVDALRYDFAFTSDSSSIFGLKTVESLLTSQPENAKIYKFIADVS
jgi:phosphatidylinositol glycan class O